MAQARLRATLTIALIAAATPGLLAQGNGNGNGNGNGRGGGGGDDTPPAPVIDLARTGATHRTISLDWMATGDDGLEGIATRYDVRYAFEMITEDNWDQAMIVGGEPAPGEPGTLESYELPKLYPSRDHYIAVKVLDEQDNASALSNVILASTGAPPATPWSISPVFESGWSGEVHLAVNPITDMPSIAFQNRNSNGDGFIMFARWTGAAWTVEVVMADDGGYRLKHAYGPDGTPYIAFGGSTKFLHSTNLAWHDGTQWRSEYVDQVGINARFSLAIDPNGNPSLAYWRRLEPNGPHHAINDVVVATRVNSNWEYQVIASVTTARHVALLYHPDSGLPLVAYGENEQTLASFDGQAWQFVPVPLTRADWVRLAINPITGEASLTSSASSSTPAEFCTLLNTGTWNCEVYNPAQYAGQLPSLLMLPDGTPAIAYRLGIPRTGRVFFFSWFDQLANAWVHEEIDVTGYAGSVTSSLARTASGQLLVAFSREVEDSNVSHLYFGERAGN